ncbi:hypothetical protein MACJ_001519 [Theileria orientalis]|uniref:Uncharacterized protein n=1 Tax=Theileria orientalis TaxID=68886 RepID=A0A976QSK7_THEOR|nr:hypothetical protein MACJ_001519 [Theileria orientalis]
MNVSSRKSFLIHFVLLFCSNYYRHYKGWLSNFALAQDEEIGEPQLWVVDLDVKHKSSTEYTEYTYDQLNQVERFTAKRGFLINGIFKGEKFISEASNHQYFSSVLIYTGSDGGRKLTALLPHEPEPADVPRATDPSQVPPPQLIMINVKNKRPTDQVKYKYDQNHDVDRFTCKPGFLIYKVVRGERTVTEVTDEKYYDRVILHRGANGKKKLTVLYPGEPEPPEIPQPGYVPPPVQVQLVELDVMLKQETQYYKYKFDLMNDIERFTAKTGFVFSRIVKGEKLVAEVQDMRYYDRVLIYRDENGKKRMTTMFPGEEELVVLNLKDKQTTDEFTYKYTQETDRQKFTCNEGFLIYKVIKGDTLVTQVADNNYYDRVIIERDPAGGRMLTLLYPNDPDVRDPEEPYPPFKIAKGLIPAETEIGVDLADAALQRLPGVTVTKQPTRDPVHIDLDIYKECDLYHVKNDTFQGISTITARPGYGFKEVRHAADTIWNFDECTKSVDHPHKILMKESGGEKHVAIVFDNDYFVFRRPGKHQPWQDLSDRRYDLRSIRFFKGNPNNLDSLVPLERHDYTVGTRYITIEYKFNPGVECTEIRYDKHVMWRYVNKFPKALHLNVRLNTFVMVFSRTNYVVLNVPPP